MAQIPNSLYFNINVPSADGGHYAKKETNEIYTIDLISLKPTVNQAKLI
ncbi:hypothetical protein COLO4_20017 [Corchorus olitorius]|uniref:Uncharacterized protein n=1 Tax=Corchorus olitorius TaxID=93759 RepID=A0A1R3J297_9ROSI|nr:hypothetical protein COLO4_20017 [Corchorus olitorius]